MNYSRIVCFDLEMCCWNETGKARTGEIIEIGLAEIDLVQQKIVKRAQYYVKPERDRLSEFCIGLTGIEPKMIAKQGRSLEQVLLSIQRNFGGKNKIYASWGRDDRILQKECLQKQIPLPFKEFLNLATLYAIKQRLNHPRIGHRKAQESLGIAWEGRQHSGYVDAYNLAKLALVLL